MEMSFSRVSRLVARVCSRSTVRKSLVASQRGWFATKSNKTQTAFLYHPVYLEHDGGPGHPECPDRLTGIVNQLKTDKLWDKLHHHKPKEIERNLLELTHHPGYIDLVQREIEEGESYLSTGDTNVSPGSWNAALYAAGAGVDAVDLVMSEKSNVKNAFCAVRPPGHHANSIRGMGFCVFNNIAVAARYAVHKYQLQRVMIIDWDFHHGNGTQDIFYEDGKVMVFNTHQWGAYPGTGSADEKGSGAGEGLIVNFPQAPYTGDEEFEKLYYAELVPRMQKFNPQLVLVSAGYDAHKDDYLGSLGLTEEGFRKLASIVTAAAEKAACQGKIICFLEGGYNIEATANSVSLTIQELIKAASPSAAA